MKRKTTDQIIKEFRSNREFDNCDLSKIVYINNKTKVKIICDTHGEFLKVPSGIHSMMGCPNCISDNSKHTNFEFIGRAKLLHGDKYDYSLVEYNGGKEKIKIICKKHGVFEQEAASHINKKAHGCPSCANNKKYTKEELLLKFKDIHGNKYDYSLVKFNNSQEKIKIICKEHGVFKQIITGHLGGRGCRKCAEILKGEKRKYDNDKFITLANIKHNNFYDYSLVEYVDSYSKVKIICPEHGLFKQKANCHLNGHGCRKCGVQFSKYHEEIKQFLINNDIKFIENDRNILDGLELDFYIPDKNLAIEVNGIYWHSEEMGKDKLYHLNKTIECEKKRVNLIHIFESEFQNNCDHVLQKIKYLLGLVKKSKIIGFEKINQTENIFTIQCVTTDSVFEINFENHKDGLLISNNIDDYLIDFNDNDWVKLSHILMCDKIYKSIDRRWNYSMLFLNQGFRIEYKTDPKCWYFRNKSKRYELLTCDDIIEDELYYHIWDCGNISMIKNISC
jgi:very-short-patch-repair endonuclease